VGRLTNASLVVLVGPGDVGPGCSGGEVEHAQRLPFGRVTRGVEGEGDVAVVVHDLSDGDRPDDVGGHLSRDGDGDSARQGEAASAEMRRLRHHNGAAHAAGP